MVELVALRVTTCTVNTQCERDEQGFIGVSEIILQHEHAAHAAL